jgi:type IX secretion system PorP/SprF family membrane protein
MQYSQFYAAPLQLNPAMTGVTELTRMGANYRKQWPGLNYDFQAFSAYMDHYSFDRKSGFGLSLNSFQESNLRIGLSDISAFYAYNLRLTEDAQLRFGGQAAVVRRHAAMDHLLLSDQIDVFSRTISPVTRDDIPDFEPYSYLDLGFGMLLTGERHWIGSSAYHLNRPNLSFYAPHFGDRLPVKYNFHGGYVIPLNAARTVFEEDGPDLVFFAGNYKQQGPFRQLDLSGQIIYRSMLVGLGFRGIPGVAELPNRDSVIALIGISTEGGLMIGYSFDYMISSLGMQTHGAHEISIRYQFFKGIPQSRAQKSRILRCFKYMM